MRLFTLLILISSFSIQAKVGKILKFNGKNDSFVLRKEKKIKLGTELLLEENDQIYSNNSQILIAIYPRTQLILDKNSSLNLSTDIDFRKGRMKVRVESTTKESGAQKILADQIAFASSSAEFEISYGTKQDIDLFVEIGEVEASSPLVQTFVPEIIKKKEGFKFSTKDPSFMRRPYSVKMKTDLKFNSIL